MVEIIDAWGDEFQVDLDARKGKKPKKSKPDPDAETTATAEHVKQLRKKASECGAQMVHLQRTS